LLIASIPTPVLDAICVSYGFPRRPHLA
jgi:hypothetical protein